MHLLLPYFIILIVLIQLKLRKNSKKNTEWKKNFWERESEANNVRKKNIDNLDYIIIPAHMQFDDIETENHNIITACNNINSLRSKKILNLTGITNTDLKMQYGVGNLSTLTEYDDNFATLARDIVTLGKLLMDNDYTEAAVELLEFGIQCKTDVSTNYSLLADYYENNHEQHRIEDLIKVAEELQSMNKDLILSKLNSYS